jgi:hypothetical protein
VKFWNARAVAERRAAFITTAGVDAIKFHGVIILVRVREDS